MSEEAKEYLNRFLVMDGDNIDLGAIKGVDLPKLLEAYHQEQLKKASIKATMQKGQAFDAAIYMHINDVTGPPPKETGTGNKVIGTARFGEGFVDGEGPFVLMFKMDAPVSDQVYDQILKLIDKMIIETGTAQCIEIKKKIARSHIRMEILAHLNIQN